MAELNTLTIPNLTTNSGQPLSFYTSPDPTAERPVWTYRGRLRSMLGYDTSFFYASEHMRDGLRDYFCFVNGDRIELLINTKQISAIGGFAPTARASALSAFPSPIRETHDLLEFLGADVVFGEMIDDVVRPLKLEVGHDSR